MNELQIDYFLSIAENLSFTKTAAEKYVSQPAISKQIAQLEETLGVTLFERGRKSTQLTDAGRLFAEHFLRQRVETKTITRLAQTIQSQGGVSFGIATGQSWTLTNILSPATNRIKSAYPNTAIFLESLSFEALDAELHGDRADVVIGLTHSIRKTPSIEIRHFTELRRLIAFSKSHPAAKKKNPLPRDFKDEVFFYPAPYEATFIKNLIKGCVEPYGFMPKLRAVSNDRSMIANVVNGFGVAMIDTWFLEAYRHDVKAVPLDTTHSVSLAWKKDNPKPMLELFLDAIKPPAPFLAAPPPR